MKTDNLLMVHQVVTTPLNQKVNEYVDHLTRKGMSFLEALDMAREMASEAMKTA